MNSLFFLFYLGVFLNSAQGLSAGKDSFDELFECQKNFLVGSNRWEERSHSYWESAQVKGCDKLSDGCSAPDKKFLDLDDATRGMQLARDFFRNEAKFCKRYGKDNINRLFEVASEKAGFDDLYEVDSEESLMEEYLVCEEAFHEEMSRLFSTAVANTISTGTPERVSEAFEKAKKRRAKKRSKEKGQAPSLIEKPSALAFLSVEEQCSEISPETGTLEQNQTTKKKKKRNKREENEKNLLRMQLKSSKGFVNPINLDNMLRLN